MERDAGDDGNTESVLDVTFDHAPSANLDDDLDPDAELPRCRFSELSAVRAGRGHDHGQSRQFLRCDRLAAGQRVIQRGDEHDVVGLDLAVLQSLVRVGLPRPEDELHLAVEKQLHSFA